MVERRHLLQHLELAAHAFGLDQTVAVPALPPRAAPVPVAAPAPIEAPPPDQPGAAAVRNPATAPVRPPAETATTRWPQEAGSSGQPCSGLVRRRISQAQPPAARARTAVDGSGTAVIVAPCNPLSTPLPACAL